MKAYIVWWRKWYDLIFRKKEKQFVRCGTPYVYAGLLKLQPSMLEAMESCKSDAKIGQHSGTREKGGVYCVYCSKTEGNES